MMGDTETLTPADKERLMAAVVARVFAEQAYRRAIAADAAARDATDVPPGPSSG